MHKLIFVNNFVFLNGFYFLVINLCCPHWINWKMVVASKVTSIMSLFVPLSLFLWKQYLSNLQISMRPWKACSEPLKKIPPKGLFSCKMPLCIKDQFSDKILCSREYLVILAKVSTCHRNSESLVNAQQYHKLNERSCRKCLFSPTFPSKIKFIGWFQDVLL